MKALILFSFLTILNQSWAAEEESFVITGHGESTIAEESASLAKKHAHYDVWRNYYNMGPSE